MRLRESCADQTCIFLHYGKTMLESWMFSSGKKKLQREEYAGVEEIFVLEQRYIVDAKVLKREG